MAAAANSEHRWSADSQPELLRRDRLLFAVAPPTVVYGWRYFEESRLEHWILNHARQTVGRVTEWRKSAGRGVSAEGRPRFSQVDLAMLDEAGDHVLKLERPAGVFISARPVIVKHQDVVVGSLRPRGRACVIENVSQHKIGAIRRRTWRSTVDYEIEDGTRRDVGRISGPAHIGPGGSHIELGGLRPLLKYGEPKEHTLFIDDNVDLDLRMMMVAAAGALYLVLQRPYVDGD
jgi:hypothetical protein